MQYSHDCTRHLKLGIVCELMVYEEVLSNKAVFGSLVRILQINEVLIYNNNKRKFLYFMKPF